MSTLLPSAVAFLSNNNTKYLHYVSDSNADRFRFLQFSGEQILSPNVKFHIERASTGNGRFVHIRASFSNKYLRRESSAAFWIMAVADEPEEDQSKWECTLFEPIQVQAADGNNNNLVIRLRHVQLNHYLREFSPNERFQAFLFAEKSTISNSNTELFTVTNWATLVELPRFITLKGDNGKYLTPTTIVEPELIWGMRFNGNSNGDISARVEVIPNSDGSVVLKYNHNRVELTVARNTWNASVPAYSEPSVALEPRAWFQPTYVDEDVIAFLGHPRNDIGYGVTFLNRNIHDSLVNEHRSIMDESKLVVEEPIIRRVISITYRLEDARIYDLAPITLITSTEENQQSLTTITKHVSLNYETTTTTTWTTTASVKVGFKYTLNVDLVPIIAKQSFEFSAELAGSYEFGKTTSTRLSFTDGGTYTIKPRHRLIVRKVATQGRCDIPYSYTQTDFMMNGDVIGPVKKEDGVFNGVNCFDIHTTTSQEPLDA